MRPLQTTATRGPGRIPWKGGLALAASGWLLLNFLQAAFTQLDGDEAYYWMYAHELDWGYFDHPPLVAVLINLSSRFFSGELAVRFLTPLLSVGTLFCIWQLAGRPKKSADIGLLLLLIAAQPLLHVYAFITTPDVPLIFFTALFFLLYRQFLLRKDAWIPLALGLCAAALLYSKYHGLLVIAFTLLSNPRLLREGRFYATFLVALLAFSPHVWWQLEHEFPSLRYQLAGRSKSFDFRDVWQYLLNQWAVFNPIVLPFLLLALVKIDRPGPGPSRRLQRAFYFNLIGFWGFFFAMAFRGPVEPHWTAVLSIPLIVLSFRFARQTVGFQKRLRIILWVGAILLLPARILILDLPALQRIPLLHKNAWVARVEERADGTPLLFLNHYRDPSVYSFYSGQPAYSVSTVLSRRLSQFDYWDWEKRWHGKRVMIAGPATWDCPECDSVGLTSVSNKLLLVEQMPMVQGIEFRINSARHLLPDGDSIRLELQWHNPYPYPVRSADLSIPIQLLAAFKPGGERFFQLIPVALDPFATTLPAGESRRRTLVIPRPENWAGPGQFGFTLQAGALPAFLPRHTIALDLGAEKRE